MIPEIGHFALILALSLAVIQGVIPLVGAHRNDAAMMAAGRTAANGQFFFVAFAFACLTYAFVQDDFSVAYVANHGITYRVQGLGRVGCTRGLSPDVGSDTCYLDRRRRPFQPQPSGGILGTRTGCARLTVYGFPAIHIADV
jgi:hypothetical protein